MIMIKRDAYISENQLNDISNGSYFSGQVYSEATKFFNKKINIGVEMRTTGTTIGQPTTLEELEKEIQELVNYAQLKIRQRDWHGVADAMMDSRELEAKKELLLQQENKGG